MVDRIATREEQIEYAKSRGDEVRAAALANSKRADVPGLDLQDIPWSSIKEYGYTHGSMVAMLGYELGTVAGLSDFDLDAVKLAGLMHDVGRSKPWQFPDPGHQKLSAELAERALRGGANTHFDARLRERVGWLITHMDLSARELPKDPALQVLWDCDALESARFAPGTPEGHRIWRERTKQDRLCTAFARDRDRRLQVLKHHGWPGV